MSAAAVSCAECRTLLGGYVLDALEPGEREAVRDHLVRCRPCAREFRQLSALPMLLDVAGGEELSPEPPPATLEEAVLDRFAREHRSDRRRRRRRLFPALPRRLAPRPLAAFAVGALAAAALAIGLTAGLQGGGAKTPGGSAFNASLSGSGGATASARLVTFSEGTRIQLRVSGLHGSPGAVYELWCVRDDGAKVSAGTFRVDGTGRADVALTTAAYPADYHVLRVERQAIGPAGDVGHPVLAGSIRYPQGVPSEGYGSSAGYHSS